MHVFSPSPFEREENILIYKEFNLQQINVFYRNCTSVLWLTVFDG